MSIDPNWRNLPPDFEPYIPPDTTGFQPACLQSCGRIQWAEFMRGELGEQGTLLADKVEIVLRGEICLGPNDTHCRNVNLLNTQHMFDEALLSLAGTVIVQRFERELEKP